MIRFLLLLFGFSILLAGQAQAMFTASNRFDLDFKKETHVVVAGRGDELGLLFQKAAISKAEYLLKKNPNAQVILYLAHEISADEQRLSLKKTSFKDCYEIPGSLNSEYLFNTLQEFKNIKSIDFFTHASVKFGLRLDTYEQRLESIDSWHLLKNSMAEFAYVFFHGCNTGFELAPKVSKILNLATMGSLTSTDFQKLTSISSFENPDYSSSETNWNKNNVYRMKPDNAPYVGHWGDFASGGLGFYKTFCVGISEKVCQKSMFKMIENWHDAGFFSSNTSSTSDFPNTNLVDYQKKVIDFLCPGSNGSKLRKDCEKGLLSRNQKYNSFLGPVLSCDFQKCHYGLICAQFDDKCSLTVEPRSGHSVGSILVEFESFMSGFKL